MFATITMSETIINNTTIITILADGGRVGEVQMSEDQIMWCARLPEIVERLTRIVEGEVEKGW